MKRRVFYSFHYAPDVHRVSQVRNIGKIEDNHPASDNDWETVKRGGEKAIKNWIDSQLSGRTCTVVLIGKETANRKWINYEIAKSWNDGKGIFGIYIHNLKNLSGEQSTKGANPFDYVQNLNGTRLSRFVHVYDPPFSVSTNVYKHISENLSEWIEDAIKSR